MQGWICYDVFCDGTWLVNFPQYGEKDDIATLSVGKRIWSLIAGRNGCKDKRTDKAKFDDE